MLTTTEKCTSPEGVTPYIDVDKNLIKTNAFKHASEQNKNNGQSLEHFDNRNYIESANMTEETKTIINLLEGVEIVPGMPACIADMFRVSKSFMPGVLVLTAEGVADLVTTTGEGYEAIYGAVVPYYDFELDFDTEAEMSEVRKGQYKRCMSELSALWPDKKPNIYALDASGFAKGKGKWRISFHFIVRGVGHYECGHLLKEDNKIPKSDGWDISIYKRFGKRQLFRLFGASKTGEGRPLNLIHEGKIATFANVSHLPHIIMSCLAQHVAGEVLVNVDTPEPKQVLPSAPNAPPMDIIISDEEPVRELVKIAGAFTQSWDWQTWINWAWMLRNIADDTGVDLNQLFRDISEAGYAPGSRLHAAGQHYDESHADTVYAISSGRGGARLTMGTLRQMASTADKAGYDKWRRSYGCKSSDILAHSVRKLVAKQEEVVEAVIPSFADIPYMQTAETLPQLFALLDTLPTFADKAKPPIPEVPKIRDPAPEQAPPPDVPTREPFTYSDVATVFCNGPVTLEQALLWVSDSLIGIENKGAAYVITKDYEAHPNTGRDIMKSTTRTIKDLIGSLAINAQVINPHYSDKLAEEAEVKRLKKQKLTEAERVGSLKHLYTKVGFAMHGFGLVTSCIENRTAMKWYAYQDFIPYCASNIPDEHIRRTIKNPKIFNDFEGFPYDNDSKGPAESFEGSPWWLHMRDILCNGSETEFRSLLVAVADMVQRPYRVSGVLHMFYGPQGIGKSSIIEFIEMLIGGDHVMTVHNMALYNQKFNHDHRNKILKVFEEVSSKGTGYVNHDTIKFDCTKPTTRIEVKNGAIYDVRNCARMWFIGNNEHMMHTEGSDRRSIYHMVSSARRNDRKYFGALKALLKDDAHMRGAFQYFAAFEYKDTEAMTAIDTNYKNREKISSLPNALQSIRDIVEGEHLQAHDLDKVNGRVPRKVLYGAYVDWCKENNTQPQKQGTFEAQIEKVGITKCDKKQRINGLVSRTYLWNIENITEGFRTMLSMPDFAFELTPLDPE